MEQLEPKKSYRLKAPKGSPERMGLLAAFDLRIDLGDGFIVEIGRFSHGVLHNIRLIKGELSNPDDPVVKIGAFCEAANDAVVIVGGEHRNENLFNSTLGRGGRFYKTHFMTDDSLHLCAPRVKSGVHIGDCVILSQSSIVLDGANLQDGCLIGAGAVISGIAEPFGIYAGSPARNIRERFDVTMQRKHHALRMSEVASHCVPLLPSTAFSFQTDAIDHQTMRSILPVISARPQILLKASVSSRNEIDGLQITGCSVPGVAINAEKTQRLQDYFGQLYSDSDEIDWCPDPFLALGIISLQC